MKIVLKHLTKVFTNKKTQSEVRAVDDLDIEIPDGKLVGLLGPSGCGKSTTLFMISGLQTPTDGQIFFDDQDVTQLAPEKRGIGLVFQNYALYPHMTVRKNILFPLENLKGDKRLSKKQAEDKMLEAARLVQIDDLLDRKPSELSGGQQQRVAIARALVKNPNVLLLDEPLSNLDARLRLQTREEIKRIQRETGVTTIFVTHDQEEAMSISDFIVVMKKGVVQQIDAPQKVYDDPHNLFVAKFLGTPPINVFAGLIKDHKVYINDEAVMDTEFEDQEIYVGIRPEGFIVDDKGVFTCEVKQLEVMGRDISIISSNPACEKPTIRSIVDASVQVPTSGSIHFNLKPNKVFLFNKETEVRLGFEPPVNQEQAEEIPQEEPNSEATAEKESEMA